MSWIANIKLRRTAILPSGREAWRVLIPVALLAGLLALSQEVMFTWLRQRFEQGSIAFPFALAPVTRAGAATNLIGWGFMLNETPVPLLQWLLAQLLLLLLAVLAVRLIGWSPVAMAAGGIANLIELELRGSVLDWIIIPMGSIIKAISLGDVAIYVGVVWCAAAVCLTCIRRMRSPNTLTPLPTPLPSDTPPAPPTPHPSAPPSSRAAASA